MSAAAVALARRRAREDLFLSREEFIKDKDNVARVARWEQRTSKAIEKKELIDRANKLTDNDEKILSNRRNKICQLYQREMAEWKEMVVESQEISMEGHMEQIREKAFRLKAKREAERRSFVKECYERQWRDGCDEARILDSRAIMDKLMRDRNDAVACKESRTKESQMDSTETAEWKKRLKDLEDKEFLEQEKRHRKNIEIKLVLDEQVKSLREKREILKRQKLKEENEQIEFWRSEEERLRENEINALRESHARGEEILKTNICRHKQREHDIAMKREQDKLMLQYAIGKEEREIANERAEKEKGKNIASEYVTFFREQLLKEKENTDAIDRIREAEMEKISTKRDNALKVQEEARRRLMTEVSIGRQQQIMEKAKQQEAENQELAEQLAKSMEEWRNQEEAEREERIQSKARTVDNMVANKAIIDEKRLKQALFIRETHLMTKQIEYAEKQHQQKLSQQSGNVLTYYPLKHTKWYS
mmetsp:Transcript_15781/g.23440  ORF Transcript_15781/g.23440 Transcript_15781/m.23440 type:complete len:479 (+) Transcript_15781:278-1714(+)